MKSNSSTSANGIASQLIPVKVSEDFPSRVSKIRYKLIPFMRDAIQQNKRAFLRYDKLIIDGQAYVYDEISGQPVRGSNQ